MNRLTQVVEYPASGSSYATSYAYNALDNLTAVYQSSENRSFAYDSLGRLWGATNPENYTPSNLASVGCAGGTYAICYSYDGDGNLISRLDNRGIGIQYAYDGQNRILSKSYYSYNGSLNYQAVSYSYDNPSVAYSKGRLTAVSTLPGAYLSSADTSVTNYLSYDALGRVTSSSQTTAGTTYPPFSYSYNWADSLTSVKYPSGRVVQTCYDVANRLTQVGGAS